MSRDFRPQLFALNNLFVSLGGQGCLSNNEDVSVESLPVHRPEAPVSPAEEEEQLTSTTSTTNGNDVADDHTDARQH